jgi:phage protein D
MLLERSLRKEGLPTDYYAPDHKIEIEGQALDPETKGDVLDIKVTMDVENLTGISLNINNWDDRRFRFKYSDTKTFDVGNRIHVKMGYAGRLLSVARGVITSLTPHFPESGPPTLGVGGQDSLVKLRDKKPGPKEQKVFIKKTDAEIVKIVADRNHLKFRGPKKKGKPYDVVVQKDQSEAMFIKERASRIDYDCYIQIDPVTGDETLTFEEPADGRNGHRTKTYVFEWGKSLINFNPELTIAEQVGTLTVRGWDPHTKKPIQFTAGPTDLPRVERHGLSGPEAAQKRLNEKNDYVVDRPVTSTQEARELAISLLREKADRYITGSGQVIGLPDLRPDDNVELNGLGQRFSGTYHVLKVEHSIGSSGFLTKFEVRKSCDGGVK